MSTRSYHKTDSGKTNTMGPTQPRTMPHTFRDPILKAHFVNTPMPAGSFALIDLPRGTYLDTEQEINVIAAALWIMSVRYDRLAVEDRPKTRENLRRWIIQNRLPVIEKMADKVEPPFTAWSIDQIQKDVGAMMEELLLKTMPPPDKAKEGDEADRK